MFFITAILKLILRTSQTAVAVMMKREKYQQLLVNNLITTVRKLFSWNLDAPYKTSKATDRKIIKIKLIVLKDPTNPHSE